MLGGPKILCGLEELFPWIGGIALRSIDDYNLDVSDISDWLCGPELVGITDPNYLPPGLMKEMALGIFQPHRFVTWDNVYPLWRELTTQNTHIQVELADLLITTTILTPLVRAMWKDGSVDLANKQGSDIDSETLTQIILFWNENCVLTLDARPADLIKSVTYVANTMGIFWCRPKRRKFPIGNDRALDPTLRVVCPNFNHIRSSDLLNKIRRTPAPLSDIAGQLTSLRCAFVTPDGPRHATLGTALKVMSGVFYQGQFSMRTTIVDHYDVIRD